MSEVELTEGIKVIDSKLGTRATFFAHPMCLLSLNGRMTEDNGEVIGMALAWPANFKLEFEKNNNQELRVLAGMNPYASHYKLKKGDVFQTPSFLYTYSTKGNGQVSRNFHRWARKYGLRHGENSRYTLMNNWEATYFNCRVHSYIQTLVLRDSTGRVPVAGEREYVHVPVAGLPSQDVFRIVYFGGLPFQVPPRYRT